MSLGSAYRQRLAIAPGKRRGKVKLALLLTLPAGLLYGCVAYQFSSDAVPVTDAETRTVGFQDLVVGVERASEKKASYDLEKFVDGLKQSRVFRQVDFVERVPGADLIFSSFSSKVTSPYHACLLGFEGQILTVATIGLLPQICKTDYEVSFDLYSPKNLRERKTVTLRYQTRSVLGWAALFYLPSSGWSAQPDEDEYPTLLKSSLYRQAGAIQQLLK